VQVARADGRIRDRHQIPRPVGEVGPALVLRVDDDGVVLAFRRRTDGVVQQRDRDADRQQVGQAEALPVGIAEFVKRDLHLLGVGRCRIGSEPRLHKYVVDAPAALAPGDHEIRVDFAYDGGPPGSGGTATIRVDGNEVARGRIEQTVPVRVSADETFDIGEDTGTPVVRDYDVPFRFTGTIRKVVVELEPS
jgi:hypothetical protein